MIFSERDVALLRLLCWCQNIRPEDLQGLFTSTEVENLMFLKLIRPHKASGTLVLSQKGVACLSEWFSGAIPKLTQSYHGDAIQRRIRLSKLALTAFQASADIFTTAPEELSKTPSMFFTAVTRNRGVNPWGSTRMAALGRFGEFLCAIHYVFPDIGKVALTDELTAFFNQTALIKDVQPAFIFAGDCYQSILAELRRTEGGADSKLMRYGDAYRHLNIPVYLLPCNDTGAIQLRLMSVPDYRTKLAEAALGDHYRPPPKGAPWDALFQGEPFVMAADMDLRRIDAALQLAAESGHGKITMTALEAQARAVLVPRYRNTGRVNMYTLAPSTLEAVLGGSLTPYRPPQTQFLTEKGDVVNAPPFQTHRKAGGSGRK